jgi:DNA/RNA-binding domain of Phe-tRNA-synthetase-like protein
MPVAPSEDAMLLHVAPDLLELGLASCALVARGADNARTPPELIAYRRATGERLAGFWKNRSISAHPAVREYHRVHELFGAAGQAPAPEKLITFLRRRKDLTASGALVDCYNVVSVRTLLSIGAHDLAKLATPITLRRTTDADTYVPLGGGDEVRLPGEYAYIDPQNRIICRLETLQGDYSKVSPETRDLAFFLQGNRCISPGMLLKGAWLLAEMVEKFCGARAELDCFYDAPAAPVPPGKPTVPIDTFKGAQVVVGSVLDAQPHPTMSALSVVRASAGKEVEALALTSTLPAGVAGRKVVLFTGLHPLTVGDRAFTAYAPAAWAQEGGEVPEVVSTIPDGKKLY